ncbi:hypothetical protein FACS1894187_25370 [Synergistales bacterium]|nr:hypothetical protein FACS1894187_25370 [Synergistales bacterium]
MNKTDIDWCDSTWNPVTGCLHDCPYCYARGIAQRFKGFAAHQTNYRCITKPQKGSPNIVGYELDAPLKRIEIKTAKLVNASYPFGFDPTLHRYRLTEPAKMKKPQIIFVGSMADLFGDWVPTSWIEEVFAACAAAPWHTYLFLTKNPTRYIELAKEGLLPKQHYYGTTVTDHDTPYFWSDDYHTFISIEPLLRWDIIDAPRAETKPVDGIIIGAETGNRHGKVVPQKAWIDDITQCADDEGILVFYKKSLIPIVGVGNMRRELPCEVQE